MTLTPCHQVFLSDTNQGLTKQLGFTMGERLGRYAVIIEKDGTISYAEKEPERGVTVSI
jgi:alkyl hydroperoxide reductase 1